MKKLFALFLACTMLFLTACNQTPPNETTSGNPQLQERPKDSELKDTIIRNGYSNFIDLPSRILFEYIVPGEDEYTFYYSKADGKAYVYCFDPLCDHSGKCLANPRDDKNIFHSEFRSTFFINNRFYVVADYGQIFSMAFDGSDIRIEYGEESYNPLDINYYLWSQNYRAYDKYIYISTHVDENEKYNVLRFNTETKEMENLTEKTGNFMNVGFFYNGEIYGGDIRGLNWFKADLEMKNMESIEVLPISTQFDGSVFWNSKFERIDSKTKNYLGLESYDMKTGETKLFTNEMLGLEEDYRYSILCVDENYVYFKQYREEQILIGTRPPAANGRINKVYSNETGKLYRMKHDGTECTLIYDNPNFEFKSLEAVVCRNKLIFQGQEYATGADGYLFYTFGGMLVGTMGEDGKFEKLEMLEFVY